MKKLWCVLLVTSLGLSGCFSEEQTIEDWMAEQKNRQRPKLQPIPQPKAFIAESYVADGLISPFDALKLTQGLVVDTSRVSNSKLIEAERMRRPEPLEAYPLDNIEMVGFLRRDQVPVALIKVESLIHQIRIGNYLGQNYGKVVKISDTEIQLREVVRDATGDWVEKMTSMQLQEKESKK